MDFVSFVFSVTYHSYYLRHLALNLLQEAVKRIGQELHMGGGQGIYKVQRPQMMPTFQSECQ